MPSGRRTAACARRVGACTILALRRSGTVWACAGILVALGACGGGGGSTGSTSGTSTPPPSAPASGLWASGYYPAYAHRRDADLGDSLRLDDPCHPLRAGRRHRDGTLADPDGLRGQTSALVSAAHAAGVKVLLGVGGDVERRRAGGIPGLDDAGPPRRPSWRTSSTRWPPAATTASTSTGRASSSRATSPTSEPSSASLRDGPRPARAADPLPAHVPGGTSSGFDDCTRRTPNMLAPVQGRFDQINLQTYVMAGPFPGWVTWHNSPLVTGSCRFTTHRRRLRRPVDSTVAAFVAAGIVEEQDRHRHPARRRRLGRRQRHRHRRRQQAVPEPGTSRASKPDGSDQDIGAPSYDGGWNFVNAADDRPQLHRRQRLRCELRQRRDGART